MWTKYCKTTADNMSSLCVALLAAAGGKSLGVEWLGGGGSLALFWPGCSSCCLCVLYLILFRFALSNHMLHGLSGGVGVCAVLGQLIAGWVVQYYYYYYQIGGRATPTPSQLKASEPI
jgi:hypothetical protein